MIKINIKTNFFLFLLLLGSTKIFPQTNCYFKPPVFSIDFGNAGSTSAIQIDKIDNYQEDDDDCVQDGYYSIRANTGGCFFGNWVRMMEDHTPGDVGGNMMIVNAAMDPGFFFSTPVNNIKSSTTYEISVWIINICTGDNGCTPTPPNLTFNLYTSAGRPIVVVGTGTIDPVTGGRWLRYHAEFNTPAGVTSLLLKMRDNTYGGCGNDFALDDIEIRECIINKPEPPPVPAVIKIISKENKPIAKQNKPVTKPAVEKEQPVLKRTSTAIDQPEKQKPILTIPALKDMPAKIPVAPILLSRRNTIVKTIELPEAEIKIDLYDNGEIDGDTVTVYHNNSLLVESAGLSAKPVSFKIKIDKQHPHHELVMVANNLGSIPPNTSLMVITANNKRYEVFISSSEQKNASVVFDLKE